MTKLKGDMVGRYWEPVFVTRGVPKQPDYIRSKTVNRESPKVKYIDDCVAVAMKGKKFANRFEVRKALINAVEQCKANMPPTLNK